MGKSSNWTGRTVVVTGASAGVGRAVVQEFARQGANVGMLSRDQMGLDEAARDVETWGGRAVAISSDVAEADQVEHAADLIEDELGPIDVWVNNAMTTIFAPVQETRAEEFQRATEVTYLGTVHGTMAALKRMTPRNRGTIVQVGSALSYRAIPLQAAYCGAKHAIRGFTDSLRCELLHDGSNIHVTMVQLPALNTPQFNWCRTRLPRHPQPVPPIYQPEVAAHAIVWAAGHRRRELIVGGSTWQAIWGNKLLPGLLDRKLASDAWGGQQTDEPVDPNRQNNLFEPVRGGHRAHGIFDNRAAGSSTQLWATTHRTEVVGAAVLGLLIGRAFALNGS